MLSPLSFALVIPFPVTLSSHLNGMNETLRPAWLNSFAYLFPLLDVSITTLQFYIRHENIDVIMYLNLE